MNEKASSRLKVLALFVALMFAALTTRLWYLQVLATQTYVDIANNTSFRVLRVEPERGEILDAHGDPLVENRESLVVTVQQQLLGAEREAVLFRLAQHLEVPEEDIVQRLESTKYYDYQRVPVAVDVEESKIFYIAEHAKEFPGVGWGEQTVRRYPQGPLAAQVLGQVGLIGPEQVNDPAFKAYGPNDTIGIAGLEETYERFLHGTAGTQKIVVNPAGKLLDELGGELPEPGYDVKLYLDARIQEQVERNLLAGIERARGIFDENTHRNYVANAGAAVVMDPATFGIEAMASWPTFDPNWYVKGLTKKTAPLMRPASGQPLYDRSVQGTYAPGSTFKPFVALAALKNGVTTPDSYTACPPEWAYPLDPDNPFGNWSPYDQGSMQVPEALAVSCDTVFYQWGAEFYDRWKADQFGADSEPLQRDLKGFGFGREPGIDLPSESRGTIPTAAEAEADPKAFPFGWLPKDSILMSIGQGSVTTSPLQLATAYSAIATGSLCEPRLAEQVQTADRKKVKRIGNQECRELPYSAQQLTLVRQGLQQVLQPGGTAAFAFQDFPLARVPVMGKTGTAERPGFDAGQDTSWFAAIAGPPNDQHVIVVMVEQGGHGSTTAAPIVRDIIESLYHLGDTGVAGTEATD